MSVPADKIRLTNMNFYGYHGVIPEEGTLGQKFLVDLEVTLDLRSAGAADDVAETLDYRDLYRVVQETNEQRFNLLEGWAESIAQRILREQPRAWEVRVRIRKPSVPLGGLLDYAEVEIVRQRKSI